MNIMKTIKLLLAVTLLGGALLSTPSCGKYEDGPGISLLTKKQRLCRSWDAKEYVSTSGTTVADTDDDFMTFEKDGTGKLTIGNVVFTGTWDFNSDKTKIISVYSSFSDEVTIMRLTNKELWTKDSDGDITKFEAK